jgi:hypothetical protein
VTSEPSGSNYAPEGLPEVQAGRPTAAIIKSKPRKKAEPEKPAPVYAKAEDIAEIVKSAVLEATATQTAKISELEQLLDKLGSMPDPAQAPNRGMVLAASNASGGARPAERRSLVDEAAVKARDEKLRFLQSFAQSGDPTMRIMAEDQIHKMLTA